MTTTLNNKAGRLDLENWIVEACEDDDGHLNVYLRSRDDTPPLATETPVHSASAGEVHLRFTTARIEEAYLEQADE